MDRRLRHASLAALVAAFALCGPSAYAFSMQDKDGAGAGVPKFDLDEQLRNFRAENGAVPAKKNSFETPLGDGTLHFGVQQGSPSNFLTPGFGLDSPPSRNSREDFNRVVTPENLR